MFAEPFLYRESLIEKSYEGPRLIAEPKGNNIRNWIIRSQAPKTVMVRSRRRFRDYMMMGLSELIIRSEDLRYSPVSKETLKINRIYRRH